MNDVVKPLLNARIRPIEPADFAFIRALAAEFPTFTVPSEYLLWFFTHFHSEYCRVLDHESDKLKAYLIAMPTSEPRNGIAIWQVAAAKPNQAFALEYFAGYLRDLVEYTGAKSVSFTASQDHAMLRLIRSLAKTFVEGDVTQLDAVPAGQGECEFLLSIGRVKDNLHSKPSNTK